MKILITGTRALAKELAFVYNGHYVDCVSTSTGHDLHDVDQWGRDFLDHDLVYNCAYSGIGQQLILEYFFKHWQHDATKIIVAIGSKIISQPRADLDKITEYWPYKIHKQTLQTLHENMWPSAKCDLKIINPGAFDTPMVAHLDVPKFDLFTLAMRIKKIAHDPVIKRVDLWL